MDGRNTGKLIRGALVFPAAAAVLFAGAALKAADDGLLAVPDGMERVTISLRRLSRIVSEFGAGNTRLPAGTADLGRMCILEGYIVDDSFKKDVILVGLRSKEAPDARADKHASLRLDDLVVNMCSIGQDNRYPYCSLDPRPENVRALQGFAATPLVVRSTAEVDAVMEKLRSLLGPQEVVVGGVPRNSRHAHVMVDADYHMKEVSQGHVDLPNVRSYIDHTAERVREKHASGLAIGMARFWFHVAANTPTFEEADGIVWLNQCRVVLLTEKQRADSSGRLYDAEEDDPVAVAFSEEMSREFPKLTSRVPVYADLERLFRLRALLLAAKHRRSLESVDLDHARLFSTYAYQDERPMQHSLRGLVNYKLPRGGAGLFPAVCGGVGMDMEIDESRFGRTMADALFIVRGLVLMSRPSVESVTWVVPEVPEIDARH